MRRSSRDKCTDVCLSKALPDALLATENMPTGTFPSLSHNESAFTFLEGHPNRTTYAVFALAQGVKYTLNFVGGTLPQRKGDDLERYSRVMLTFFKRNGWRSAFDLKLESETWTEAFQREQFLAEHIEVMNNMNVLYKCQDECDDFSALRRKAAHEGNNGMIAVDQYLSGFIDIKEIDDQNVDHLSQQDIVDMLDLNGRQGECLPYHYNQYVNSLLNTSRLFEEIYLRGEVSLAKSHFAVLPAFIQTSQTNHYWHQCLEDTHRGVLESKSEQGRQMCSFVIERETSRMTHPDGNVFWTNSSTLAYSSAKDFAERDPSVNEIFDLHNLNNAQ